MERIVLAYSGGLDASIAIPWLKETFHAEVVTVTLDLGPGAELVEIRQRALALGALRAHVIDVREEFVRDYALPALQAGALYADCAPMTTALTRPLIARKLVDVARMENATAVAHGCAATTDDGLRIDALVAALDPDVRVIVPTRMWEMTRDEALTFANERGVPVPASFDGLYKTDANVWGRSTICSPAQDAWSEPPEDNYALTRSPRDCPAQPAYVAIEFEGGKPLRVNSIEMSPLEMIESLETIAGLHGVGRIDLVATRLTGGQSREIYEAPAALVLHAAHRELEQLVIPSISSSWPTRLAARTPISSTAASGSRRRAPPSTRSSQPFSRASPAPFVSSFSRATAAWPDGDRRSPTSTPHPRRRTRVPLWTLPPASSGFHRKALSVAHLWSGRFEGDPDAALVAFGRSFGFDRRLFEDDVRGSQAWAAALARAGVLSPTDAAAIQSGLEDVLQHGTDESFFNSPAAQEDEDVHAFVERELVARIGDAGRRLHTGRSRNEQVAVDLRLYLKRRVPGLQQAIVALVKVLAASAERAGDALMPSYTHLRRAQPILAAHFYLAHAAALRRDHARLSVLLDDVDELPLGSGAIAGTSYEVDVHWLAERLGFSRIVRNSIDATGDRDIVASFLYAASLTMVHLSRLAEDMILFTSEEFGFFELADTAATGSSLMPQKKNPDPLELVRGKAGRVIGRLAGWLATMKGLPIGYSKDLQEDKEALFEAEDTLRASLAATASVVSGISINRETTARAASGLLLATDVADYLVAKGVPFRDAHEVVGALVRRLVRERRSFDDLTLEDWRTHSPLFDADVRHTVTAAASVGKKRTPQSTHPDAVAKALAEVQGWVKASE